MSDDGPDRYCAFCGLPLPKGFSLRPGGQSDVLGEEFCCSGCRGVASAVDGSSYDKSAAQSEMQLGLAVFFAMNVMVFTMALWSQDVYDQQAFATPLAEVWRGLFRWGAMLFSAPVLLLLGGPIAVGVGRALRRRQITTDLLILIGVGAAYAYSAASVLRGAGHVYFEVGAMVLVFVSLGRRLEAKGKRRTGDALDALASLLPETVRRQSSSGSFNETSRSDVCAGDLLRILPGERIAVDGVVVSGQATVDQQIVTGESLPTVKSPGDVIHSGALNLDGDLRIEATGVNGNETASRLLSMVRQARTTKGPHERLADRIATWFVPFVALIAIAAGLWRASEDGLDDGIMTGLAVTLIACPCAVGLATPMAVWTALGRAAQGGVVFRSGVVMERMAKIRVACFDKTGTLTTGAPNVGSFHEGARENRAAALRAAATIAGGSTHVLSKAIERFCRSENSETRRAASATVTTLAGRGLECELPDQGLAALGSRRLMDEAGMMWEDRWVNHNGDDDADSQQVFIGWKNRVRGVFNLVEELRPETEATIDMCRALGIEAKVLTGDRSSSAMAIGRKFNLSSHCDLLPQHKADAIRSHWAEEAVAMIGDGLNDAPALAASDVGVALGCGADLSRDAAGVCLLGNDLRRFPWAVSLAHQTMRIVKQNLFWAFAYNAVGIGLAATGRLNPIWAALAMALSSVLVVSNSLRLSRFPEPEELLTILSAEKPSSLHGSVRTAASEQNVAPSLGLEMSAS